MKPDDNYKLGFILTIAGVLAFVPDGYLVRVAGLDALGMIAWRGLVAGSVMLIGSALVWRSSLWDILRRGGLVGVLAGLMEMLALAAFHFSIANTTIANVLLGFAIVPMLAAILSWVFLDDRIHGQTWITIIVCAVGMGVVAFGAMGGGTDMTGLIFALLNACALAGFYVAVRKLGDVPALPYIGIGFLGVGCLATLVSVPSLPTGQAAVALALNVGVTLPLAIALVSVAPRYLPAPEVAALTLLQTILGTAFVWWFLHEVPHPATLLGGGIIMVALLLHSIWRLRRT